MSRTRSNRHPVARSAWRPAAGSPTGEVEAVEATQRRPSAYMMLAEDPLGQVVAADWIGKFFMLGRLAARWSRAHADIQLVVVLSVPVRDFAAVLVGCGWMTATAEPSIPPVREVLARMLHLVNTQAAICRLHGQVQQRICKRQCRQPVRVFLRCVLLAVFFCLLETQGEATQG